MERSTVEGQDVLVVDTPAVFRAGTKGTFPSEELVAEIRSSVGLAKPGPHVFLLVENLQQSANEKTLNVFESTFGKHAMAYAMVVFTHPIKTEDRAELEKKVKAYNHKSLIEMFHGRHFFFYIATSREEVPQPKQVAELLKVIRQTGEEYYYTAEMLTEHEKEEAEKKRNQEQQGNIPTPAGTEDKAAFFEKSGLVGIIVGCGLGYFIGGGELTSTSGALLGAVAGMILSMGISVVAMKVKVLFDSCYKR